VATGTIVDATIINAPSSTKHTDKARDPEMHQTKKGNQWYFGMKAHLGIDSRSKLIQAAVATPANAADSTVLPDLLHGKETRVWGDQAYRGQRAVIRQHAPKAQDFTNRRYRHRGVVDEAERAKNRTKDASKNNLNTSCCGRLLAWSQSVVPLSMKLVAFDRQLGQFLVRHLDPCLVGVLVQLRADPEP
jgi:transposase, IS5 family